ncbi:MAG: hypothetical protein COT92_03820 [Candidatus Doudnabacteria bacterium CG10_big_fil_rev_8_21_14_0_10_42_18]|uniref:RNA polymerase sigma-70 region 2 domain-containing protein n=1 Tax=Candidatus Doudnabacteria bacterium CG10_big_fil_rev_8_21_14_0_10_42_18 TaxID=1974552 RepID=A0A2H0V9Z0_9BACT|nr:MAG: hypothetical protein COT92_03820 [Candidatus Doudnabacteria bacterium CG10_big_fil_rev_8_21_14_0_10_42_18]
MSEYASGAAAKMAREEEKREGWENFLSGQNNLPENLEDREIFYRAHETAIYSYILSICQKKLKKSLPDEAENAAQTALIRVFNKIGQFQGKNNSHLSTWIHKITENIIIDIIRKHKNTTSRILPLDDKIISSYELSGQNSNGPLGKPGEREELKLINNIDGKRLPLVMKSLSKGQKVLLKAILENPDGSLEEHAKKLGITKQAVKNRFVKLRDSIIDYFKKPPVKF